MELAVILFLIFLVVKSNYGKSVEDLINDSENGLLSPRVYAGLLQPKSYLITNYAPLKSNFESFIKKNNFNISIYVENLRNGAFMGIDELKGYSPASLNKVMIAMLILKKIEDKKLSLTDLVFINDSFRSNDYGDLYRTPETKLSVKILLEKMLKESDNTAYFTLHTLIDKSDVELFLNYFDYYNEEGSSINKNINSEKLLISPKTMYNIFSSLYLSTVLDQKDSEYILSLLSDSDFDIKKIALLPENTTVSQKFGVGYEGETTRYFHSCGIMYVGKSRVFYCIMTQGLEMNKGLKLIGLFVNKIYDYTVDSRKFLDEKKEI